MDSTLPNFRRQVTDFMSDTTSEANPSGNTEQGTTDMIRPTAYRASDVNSWASARDPSTRLGIFRGGDNGDRDDFDRSYYGDEFTHTDCLQLGGRAAVASTTTTRSNPVNSAYLTPTLPQGPLAHNSSTAISTKDIISSSYDLLSVIAQPNPQIFVPQKNNPGKRKSERNKSHNQWSSDQNLSESEQFRRYYQAQCHFPSPMHDTMDQRNESSSKIAGTQINTDGPSAKEASQFRQPQDRNDRTSSDFSSHYNNTPYHMDSNTVGRDSAYPTMQPTPLFERLVTEEVQELKSYARIIDEQGKKLAHLESVHRDLESRLEYESNGRQLLEATLEARERLWQRRFDELSADRDHWKEVFHAEQTKSAKLIEQVARKEQDIHRMLQRKYDHESRGMRTHRAMASERTGDFKNMHPMASVRGPSDSRLQEMMKSPREFLDESGTGENVSLRNAESLLRDFFSL